MVRPSAFAVFRLMTNSNLVDCTTGRSAGLAPLKDTTSIDADLMPCFREVDSVAHQPAGFDVTAPVISCRNPLACRRGGDLHGAAREESVRGDEEGVRVIACKGGKGRIDLLAGAGLEDLDFQPDNAGSFMNCLHALGGRSIGQIDQHARRMAFGTSSCRSVSCFVTTSAVKKLMPVRLPPGWATLATRLSLTGSSRTLKTIGIVAVAALAANAAGPPSPSVAITATRRRLGRP
jgi:hypothetical protein